jgi:type IV pilus assembly protein PilB
MTDTETSVPGRLAKSGVPSAAAGVGQRRPLGVLLMEEGLLSAERLEDALAVRGTAHGRRERLGQTLVRLGMVSEQDVARALARQLGLEYLGGDFLDLDARLTAMIPAALARRHSAIPLRQDKDGTLVLACGDPTDIVARDDIRLAAGVRAIRAAVAPASVVKAAIRAGYGSDRASGELLEAAEADAEPDEDEELAATVEEAPIIRLVDSLLAEAVDAGASDVHIEPTADGVTVRYRIDGVLRTVSRVPRNIRGKFISRLKLMGGMDIAERRVPQDGRATLSAYGADVDLRMATMPSLHGETVVLRLLRKGAERLALAEVGFREPQMALFQSAIGRPQGLILITGPTGSGKTSTLYAALGHVVGEQSNIITLEDPVEYELEGINQTQINERVGRTFARCLRTILRQDPDIVMVGEIRDLETAELAMQASLTGHLVFSTLHTNDAPGAVVRLRDLGVPPYLIAASLHMVVAQRLVRRICTRCAVGHTPTDRHIAQLHLAPRDVDQARFQVGAGCTACGFTGYRGRLGLFELLTVDSRMLELVTSNSTSTALRHAARLSGMRSLREDGLEKAAEGLTSLDELLRVIPHEADDGVCPVCAHVVEPDFGWCPACGTELGFGSCGVCHRPLERDWNACPACGTRVPDRLPGSRERAPLALVVDDDPSVRAAIAAMLDGDYHVEQATDARTALKLAHQRHPDIAVVDVTMPGMDGYALTRELRSRQATMHLPILLITGNDSRQAELEGLRAGADAHLVKPLEPEVLLAQLNKLVNRPVTPDHAGPPLTAPR